MTNPKNDIIIKKVIKKGGGGHSAAWKIAYADFVTAMMAFFLLLWLLGNVEKSKLTSIADYFTPTIGVMGQMGIGFKGGESNSKEGTKKESLSPSQAIVLGAPTSGAVVQMKPAADAEMDKVDAKNFTNIEHDLYKAINDNPELKEFSENILISQTPEGLKIELLENEKKPMFAPNSFQLNENIKTILSLISSIIKFMPNYLSIDGHSSSSKTEAGAEPWLISLERANATRIFLKDGRIDESQIARVVGKGDNEPFDKNNMDSISNRRISIILLKNSIIPYQKKSLPENVKLDIQTTN
jgi:chemotaxis protein MotB